MRNVTVQYGSQTVFKGLNWMVAKDENWAVTGPNGSGKTTLLQLITGDQPQAYANEIYLFGRRRGSGESIWEIKQRLGLVSSEFQIGYRKPLRAFDVVLSGFFDSVGLYRHASTLQRHVTRQWITYLGLRHLQDLRFDLLSYGERRMLLLARAMVKAPELLVLDEPCQGLDPANRRIILACIDTIAAQATTQILYVTHFSEELPTCITHHLDLTKFSLPKR
jgi:molybdate transport system ATP-binding protein